MTLHSGYQFQPGDRLDQVSFRTTPIRPREVANGIHQACGLANGDEFYDSEENDIAEVLASPLSGSLSGSSGYNSRPFTPRAQMQSPPSSDVHTLLQQQQSALLKVLQQQDTILEQQSQFGQCLDSIEQTVTRLSKNTTNTIGKKPRHVQLTRDLTVSGNT